MITKYGYDVVAVVVALVVFGCVLVWNFVGVPGLRISLIGVLLFFLVFTLRFFRDPERKTPEGAGLVLSPADGRVVLVHQIQEDEYLKSLGTQVSIFMSPLNVHVNRYPISGKVTHFQHIPGEYLVALDEKSSLRNERTHIGIENKKGRVFFRQVAGFVARRIVAPVQVGDEAVAGERFGMIRFGSRVDVVVPTTCEVKVQVGDRTVAGETVLAVFA